MDVSGGQDYTDGCLQRTEDYRGCNGVADDSSSSDGRCLLGAHNRPGLILIGWFHRTPSGTGSTIKLYLTEKLSSKTGERSLLEWGLRGFLNRYITLTEYTRSHFITSKS